MSSRTRAWTPALVAVVVFAVVLGGVAGILHLRDSDDRVQAAAADDGPALTATIVQTRPDEVAARVEVELTNREHTDVTVEAMRLRTDGFRSAGWVRLDYPMPPGGPIDFKTPFGEPRCPQSQAPKLGSIRVDLRVHTAAEPQRQTIVVTPTDARPLLSRILAELCTTQRLSSQVALAFGPQSRVEGRGADIELHTTIEARLTPGAPARDIPQVFGNVIYGMAPEPGAPTPLAHLDAAHPSASVPVVVTQARCTGHAKGETKQPYLFLVWLGDPGTAGTAVEVPVTATDKTRLRAVCSL